MPADATEPVMVFTFPIHFHTYLDLKREIKEKKVTQDPVLQK